MLDVVVHDGAAKGVVVRDLLTGEVSSHSAHAVVLATGGYSNVYFLSTNAKASNATAIWRAHRRGAAFANPGFVQFHPTCLPAAGEHQAKLTLMSSRCATTPACGFRAVPVTTAGLRRSPMASATTSSSAAIPATATSCRAIWAPARPRPCATRATALARADARSIWI